MSTKINEVQFSGTSEMILILVRVLRKDLCESHVFAIVFLLSIKISKLILFGLESIHSQCCKLFMIFPPWKIQYLDQSENAPVEF